MMEIAYTFTFDAAHHLPRVPKGHPCGRVHGHTYTAELLVSGPVDPAMGWVMDFALVKSVAEHARGNLDHRLLNDIAGLENPTSENLAVWIWNACQERWPNVKGTKLIQVSVSETPKTRVVYRGE